MTSAVRNRLIALGALVVAGGALGFIAFGNLGKNLVYYWSPSEMVGQGDRAFGPTIRLGGIVQKDTLQWEGQHTRLRFRVADNKEPTAPSVMVASDQLPPQMFREGIGVVVEGTFDKSQVFTAQRLMVNHSNEYRPPKAGDKGHEWKDTLSEGSKPSARAP